MNVYFNYQSLENTSKPLHTRKIMRAPGNNDFTTQKVYFTFSETIVALHNAQRHIIL
jgi:hypothetical protein